MGRMTFVAAFVGWTLAIWVGRVRNIWQDEDLTTGGQLARSGLALTFVAGAVVIVLVTWRATPTTLVKLLGVVGVWTAGVWAVRSVGILVGDWSVGFKVVHTGLAVVSVVLAAAAFSQARDLAHPSEESLLSRVV